MDSTAERSTFAMEETTTGRKGFSSSSISPRIAGTPFLSADTMLEDPDQQTIQAESNSRNVSGPCTPIPTTQSQEQIQNPASSSSSARHNDSEPQQQRRRRLRLNRKFNPTLVLENSGSVARDHLASERTFLAYVRTSLAVAATGVALVQLFTLSAELSHDDRDGLTVSSTPKHIRSYAKPIGATMVLFSIVVLLIGFHRYFTVQHALTLNRFPVARSLIVVPTLVIGVLGVIVFAVLVATKS